LLARRSKLSGDIGRSLLGRVIKQGTKAEVQNWLSALSRSEGGDMVGTRAMQRTSWARWSWTRAPRYAKAVGRLPPRISSSPWGVRLICFRVRAS